MLKRVICFLTALLVIFTVCVTAVAELPRDIIPLEEGQVPAPFEGQHHYLLTCVDNWQGNAKNLGNTDGTILVTLDVASKRVMLTTLTREMLIKRPDGGIGRFTYIAKNYGMDALTAIVRTHFGIAVDKYIVFSMDNVQQIIDAMGGVYITVSSAEADYLNRYRISRDSTKPSMEGAGTYLFGGHAAVIFMRIRKVGGGGDAGRTRRIRTVLSTLAGKYDQVTLDASLKLLGTVTEHAVETNMTMSDMLEAVGYAMDLRGVSPEGIQMPSDAALQPIFYAGMSTRQVDFDMARKELRDFMENKSFDVIE